MTEEHKPDKCVLCFCNSYQSVCEICNVKMHVNCMFAYISETNNMICPQCNQGCIQPRKYKTRVSNKNKNAFAKKIAKIFPIIEAHSDENGVVIPTKKSVDALLSLFSYIRDNKYHAMNFPNFLLIAKQKLIDVIQNPHMKKYENHYKFSYIYASIYTRNPKICKH